MKIKSDFVTNSSTTSFVMLGYVIKTNGRDRDMSLGELREKADKLGYYVFEGGEMGAPDDNSALIGEVIGEISSEGDGFEERESDLDKVINRVDQLRLDLELPVNLKPKVICTTRMS